MPPRSRILYTRPMGFSDPCPALYGETLFDWRNLSLDALIQVEVVFHSLLEDLPHLHGEARQGRAAVQNVVLGEGVDRGA